MARAGGWRHRRLQITDWRMEMGDGDVMEGDYTSSTMTVAILRMMTVRRHFIDEGGSVTD